MYTFFRDQVKKAYTAIKENKAAVAVTISSAAVTCAYTIGAYAVSFNRTYAQGLEYAEIPNIVTIADPPHNLSFFMGSIGFMSGGIFSMVARASAECATAVRTWRPRIGGMAVILGGSIGMYYLLGMLHDSDKFGCSDGFCTALLDSYCNHWWGQENSPACVGYTFRGPLSTAGNLLVNVGATSGRIVVTGLVTGAAAAVGFWRGRQLRAGYQDINESRQGSSEERRELLLGEPREPDPVAVRNRGERVTTGRVPRAS